MRLISNTVLLILLCAYNAYSQGFTISTRGVLSGTSDRVVEKTVEWNASSITLDFEVDSPEHYTRDDVDNLIKSELSYISAQLGSSMWVSFSSSSAYITRNTYKLTLRLSKNASYQQRVMTIQCTSGGYNVKQTGSPPPPPPEYDIVDSRSIHLSSFREERIDIVLNGSTVGKNYLLYRDYSGDSPSTNDQNCVDSKSGTGGPLTFTITTVPGLYKVIEYHPWTYKVMGGSVKIWHFTDYPSSNENYIFKKTFTHPEGLYIKDVTYYNGFGFPEQQIYLQNSTDGESNLVQHFHYDEFYRENILEYLPFSLSSDAFKITDPVIKQKEYYNSLYPGEGDYARAKNIVENSALDRVQSSYIPGLDMRNSPKNFDYTTNDSQELACILFSVSDAGVVNNGLYQPSQLFVSSTTDEDGNVSYEFRDKLEKTVLSRQITQENGNLLNHDTYYVHDGGGKLRYVLSPEAVVRMGQSLSDDDPVMRQFCYVYKYDHRNRCIAKRLPGKDWEYYVYDKADRLVADQDGFWRRTNQWRLYFYDNLNRNTSTWLRAEEYLTREQMQTIADASDGTIESMGGELRVEKYEYDKYDFLDHAPELEFAPVEGVVTEYDPQVQTLLTYAQTPILTNGSNICMETSYFYDRRARIIQSVQINHLGGISRTSFKYDFIGNILTKHESHQSSANVNPDIFITRFTYDQRGRLLSELTSLNGANSSIVNYTYNDLGQMVRKDMGEGTSTFTENYEYNIQGWYTGQKGNLFDSKLRYHDPKQSGTLPRYTGNITEWEWEHQNITAQ